MLYGSPHVPSSLRCPSTVWGGGRGPERRGSGGSGVGARDAGRFPGTVQARRQDRITFQELEGKPVNLEPHVQRMYLLRMKVKLKMLLDTQKLTEPLSSDRRVSAGRKKSCCQNPGQAKAGRAPETGNRPHLPYD